MNYYYTTKDAFPLITDRSEINNVDEIEVTPLQNAIATMKSKNDELFKLCEQYKDAKHSNISPFTMVLSGLFSFISFFDRLTDDEQAQSTRQ